VPTRSSNNSVATTFSLEKTIAGSRFVARKRPNPTVVAVLVNPTNPIRALVIGVPVQAFQEAEAKEPLTTAVASCRYLRGAELRHRSADCCNLFCRRASPIPRAAWGMYSGFELCESTPLPGREEYLDSGPCRRPHARYSLRLERQAAAHTARSRGPAVCDLAGRTGARRVAMDASARAAQACATMTN
jgi:hypothetical protein